MFFLRNYLPDDININFLRYKYIGLIISLFFAVVSVWGLATKGLNFGIDFQGGILIEAKFQDKPSLSNIRTELNKLNIGDISIQTVGNENNILIKSGASSDANIMSTANKIKDALVNSISPQVEFRKVEYVGAEVGEEMISDGIIAIILTFIGIMIYVWFRFNWQYSIGIVFGLIHDLVLTIGYLIYSGFEFNITSIAAILTILGYSVNDTVVMYDRIRENLFKIRKKSFLDILNLSINETLYRTLFTLLTTLIAAGSLVMFGGPALQTFSITVFVGIVIGTYSSIFISIPILSFFSKGLSKN